MNSRSAILCLLFLIPFLALAHGDKTPFSLTGIIFDESGESISGAEISIEQNGEVIHSTQSNKEGLFKLTLDPTVIKADQIKIKVKKSGFRSEELVPASCNQAPLQLHLKKAPTTIPVIRPVGFSQAIVI